MLDTQPEHEASFLKEVWGLFGIGTTVFALRFFVRLRVAGIRGFQGDDYMSIAVFVCYLVDAITVTYTYYYGTNVDFSIEALEAMSDAERHQIRVGSQMQLLAWYTYTGLIWALKACMLFFLNRLTFGLDQQQWVKVMSWVVGITYIAVFLTISVGCHPIQKNYQVLPYPGDTCAVKQQNFYVSTVLNVITDAAILCIPVPLLYRLQATLRKKLALAALLSSGIFVITAALVRIIMTLSANASAVNINRWGVRETIAGIIAVNIPILKPLFSKAFWTGELPARSDPYSRSHSSRKGGPKSSVYEMSDVYGSQSHGGGGGSQHNKAHSATIATHEIDDVSDRNSDTHGDTSSQDFIIQRPDDMLSSDDMSRTRSKRGSAKERDTEDGRPGMPELGGVMIETSYDVRPQSMDDRNRSGARGPGQEGLWRPDLRGAQGYGNHVTIASAR